MSGKKEIFSRRDFIKTAGAAGVGAALIPLRTSGTLLTGLTYWLACTMGSVIGPSREMADGLAFMHN